MNVRTTILDKRAFGQTTFWTNERSDNDFGQMSVRTNDTPLASYTYLSVWLRGCCYYLILPYLVICLVLSNIVIRLSRVLILSVSDIPRGIFLVCCHRRVALPKVPAPSALMNEDITTRGSPLVSASVFVLPSANCSEMYSGIRNISRGEFCLWPQDSTSQPCQASLGAPMYYNEQLYGMVTYTPGCSRPNLPVIVQGVSTLTTFMIFIFCDLAKILG
ncbi:hypothetical protein J6590_048096 [Homalodisca vitripennis]|nr:hypothetical protein J6590_048096 [Homalodisca vitripennis]